MKVVFRDADAKIMITLFKSGLKAQNDHSREEEKVFNRKQIKRQIWALWYSSELDVTPATLDTMMSLAKLGYEYQVNTASARAPSVSLSQYDTLCRLLAQTRSLYDTMAAELGSQWTASQSASGFVVMSPQVSGR